MPSLDSIAAVAIGSAVGGMMRYWVVNRFARWFGQRMPWGTIFVNWVGALLIGAFVVFLSESSWPAFLLISGFCGSLTTFSSAALQTMQQVNSGQRLAGMLNVVFSLAGAIPLTAASFYAASIWT